MLKKLRNWLETRYRPLSEEHPLVKSLSVHADYSRCDHVYDLFSRYSKMLDEYRLGAIFVKCIDENMRLCVILRVYYHGNQKSPRCQYRMEWSFSNENTVDQLYDVKWGSDSFTQTDDATQLEFDYMAATIVSTVGLNRIKSHADITTPVKPCTVSNDELAKRWDNWHDNWLTR